MYVEGKIHGLLPSQFLFGRLEVKYLASPPILCDGKILDHLFVLINRMNSSTPLMDPLT